MALSLQKKLELAGDLAKVQPLLHKLHILEKPEPKRHRLRNGLLAIGAIAAVVAIIGFVGRRRCCQDNAGPGDVEAEEAGLFTEDAPASEPESDVTGLQQTAV